MVFSLTLPPLWLLATVTLHHVAGSLYLVVNWVVCVASAPDESDPDAPGGKEEPFAPGLSPELLVRLCLPPRKKTPTVGAVTLRLDPTPQRLERITALTYAPRAFFSRAAKSSVLSPSLAFSRKSERIRRARSCGRKGRVRCAASAGRRSRAARGRITAACACPTIAKFKRTTAACACPTPSRVDGPSDLVTATPMTAASDPLKGLITTSVLQRPSLSRVRDPPEGLIIASCVGHPMSIPSVLIKWTRPCLQRAEDPPEGPT